MEKVVLVTGVSSGIGEATALAMARSGYRVFGGARSPGKLKAKLSGVEVLKLDVRDDEQVRSAIDQILAAAGRLDVVINNAGVSLVGPVEATSDDEALALFDTNLFGVLRVARAALPAMRKQRSGLIVNMSSVLGFLPAPFMGLYSSSKHALEGLSESLDHEVRTFGVRVMLMEPSFINTSLDTNATQTSAQIDAYGSALARSVETVRSQIQNAPTPNTVANKIVECVAARYRMRHPVGRQAGLLRVLRRFAPAASVDKSLRAAFGLA